MGGVGGRGGGGGARLGAATAGARRHQGQGRGQGVGAGRAEQRLRREWGQAQMCARRMRLWCVAAEGVGVVAGAVVWQLQKAGATCVVEVGVGVVGVLGHR